MESVPRSDKNLANEIASLRTSIMRAAWATPDHEAPQEQWNWFKEGGAKVIPLVARNAEGDGHVASSEVIEVRADVSRVIPLQRVTHTGSQDRQA